MKPISLVLKGFKGIRDGLGREAIELDLEALTGDAQLVALVGRNGRGKSTLLDCLQPFPVMPSRAGADALGSFSYYEHVYLPESQRDLVWEHGGERYRSQMVFRTNGKRKTDAFLHQRGAGGWQPVRLADGTVSDGKLDTYVRCVEGILGSAETFFTSVFCAQGKRQLTAYRNAEIKTLLADLLGLEEIRAIGARAAETAKLLKLGLASQRQGLGALQAEAEQLAQQRTALGDTQARVEAGERAKRAAQAALDEAKQALATLMAHRDVAMQTEARRTQLAGERKAVIEAGKAAIGSLDEQDRRELERLAALDRRLAQRADAVAARRQGLDAQRGRLQGTLRDSVAIQRAQRQLPRAQAVTVAREGRLTQVRSECERVNALRAAEKLALERLSGIEREAGQAALKAQELTRRLKLTTEVPCAGTDLQGACKLLGDAVAAKTLMPSAQAQISRLDQDKTGIAEELKAVRSQLATLQAVPAKVRDAEDKLRRSRDRASRLALRAARGGELDQASAALAAIVAELDALAGMADAETEDEKGERAAIAAARRSIGAQRETQARQFRASLDRIDQALAALPAPFDAAQVQGAGQRVEAAQGTLAQTEQALMRAVRDQQMQADLDRRSAALQARMGVMQTCIGGVEEKLGVWALFAKSMSNDGVIALAIDDAGPTLAGLANDLLLACYGPRFTVSIRTLVETVKGEAREGFDIVVHDAESGDAKSVTLMSGGERVWIDGALTRAIALYLAQNSGRRYETLFSDEADGALDPQRKRMFMSMKREVVRLGGYQQEFFVSQTPELTAMADAVIDLDRLAVEEQGASC